MKNHIYLLAAAWPLAACTPQCQKPESFPQNVSNPSDRVSIELVQVGADKLAYGGWRGVYIIRDKTTGVEYIGVSGIGVAELGAHPVRTGKRVDDVEDER